MLASVFIHGRILSLIVSVLFVTSRVDGRLVQWIFAAVFFRRSRIARVRSWWLVLRGFVAIMFRAIYSLLARLSFRTLSFFCDTRGTIVPVRTAFVILTARFRIFPIAIHPLDNFLQCFVIICTAIRLTGGCIFLFWWFWFTALLGVLRIIAMLWLTAIVLRVFRLRITAGCFCFR